MVTVQALAQAHRVAERLQRGLGDDIRRFREDAGVSRRALARASGVDIAYMWRIEEGGEHPSLETYARLAAALGADLGAHLYPNTGPTVRDRHQARILEWLLAELNPRWRRYTEVAVRHPSRGWIDLLIQDVGAGCLVATEIQSSLARLEQLIRWSSEKAASLPSWDGYAQLGPVAVATSRLLIVRSTRTTRAVGRTFAKQLEVAYPAHPQDAIEALTGTRLWPGAALVWLDLEGDAPRFVERR